MKKLSVLLLIAFSSSMLLFGCGKDDAAENNITGPVIEQVAPAEDEAVEETTENSEEQTEDTETPPEEGMVRSDLTNEWIDEEIADVRPIAVMIPNDATALPQYTISKADVLYEAPVESSITRLMAIFKDWRDMDRIGNVRSCRDYYVYWAFEWDSLYCHFGGPFYINDIINRADTNNINGLTAPSGVYYRTSDRSAPQNAYLSTEGIEKEINRLGYSKTYRTDKYQGKHFNFAEGVNTLEKYGDDAKDATYIDMSSCYPVTKTYFKYNEETGKYDRYQHVSGASDGPHIDALNNEQLSFENVFVQFTYYEVRDKKGYLAFQCHDTTRDGWYFTKGKGIHVNWKKTADYEPTKYYDDDGNEVEVNTGKSMICIVKDGDTFSYK